MHSRGMALEPPPFTVYTGVAHGPLHASGAAPNPYPNRPTLHSQHTRGCSAEESVKAFTFQGETRESGVADTIGVNVADTVP